MSVYMVRLNDFTGHPVCQVTSIIDLDGLGLGHRHAVGLLQRATQLDGQYYPSIIGDMYVLNWYAVHCSRT